MTAPVSVPTQPDVPERIMAPTSIPVRPARASREGEGRNGRPDALIRGKAQRMLDALSAGNTYRASCAYAKIDYGTFRRWMMKGKEARSGKFRDFFKSVLEAELQAEMRVQLNWQSQIPGDWRAAQAWLKARRQRDWNTPERVDGTMSGKEGAPPVSITTEATVRILIPHNNRDRVLPEQVQHEEG